MKCRNNHEQTCSVWLTVSGKNRQVIDSSCKLNNGEVRNNCAIDVVCVQRWLGFVSKYQVILKMQYLRLLHLSCCFFRNTKINVPFVQWRSQKADLRAPSIHLFYICKYVNAMLLLLKLSGYSLVSHH